MGEVGLELHGSSIGLNFVARVPRWTRRVENKEIFESLVRSPCHLPINPRKGFIHGDTVNWVVRTECYHFILEFVSHRFLLVPITVFFFHHPAFLWVCRVRKNVSEDGVALGDIPLGIRRLINRLWNGRHCRG